MATTAQVNSFINSIAPIVQKYAAAKGYKYPSAIIAQACLESGYGTSGLAKYHNYFGMKCGSSWKGKSVNMATQEEYTPGTMTNIKAYFRAYDSMDAGIAGYFDFISSLRYANLKNATSSKDYLEKIKSDGYATSSKYVTNVYNVVTKYNLTKYDTLPTTNGDKSGYAVAQPTIRKGSKGQQVKYLQHDLTYLGFIGSNGRKLTVDGDCGANTEYAIKEFQRKYKLSVDGIYGPKSYAKMKTLL